MWERQAEDNAIERLQKIGLLAPPGDVDKVLQTVVNNLLVTNNIDLQADVRCRVLLTSPLESFTIGHTIVISRGLLDVLPDEASLAMVLAHELSHIVLGHPFDTKLAFNDRMFFPDEDSFQRLDFKRTPADEEAADTKALELLKNSPYKDKLGSCGVVPKGRATKCSRSAQSDSPALGQWLSPRARAFGCRRCWLPHRNWIRNAPIRLPRFPSEDASSLIPGRTRWNWPRQNLWL